MAATPRQHWHEHGSGRGHGEVATHGQHGTMAFVPPSPGSARGNGHAIPGEGAQLVRALGWFSLALGLAQLASPQRVARAIGVGDDARTTSTMRMLGLREIASGVGILSQPNPASWLWGRVGGDLIDLTLLGKALSSDHNDGNRIRATSALVAGVAALDAFASLRASGARGDAASADPLAHPAHDAGRMLDPQPRIASAITINAPVADVFAFWEGFQNLPRFMSSLATVELLGDRQSRWTATLPGGMSVVWDVTITESVPNERIAWRSDEGAGVPTAGQVRFAPAPGGRGTEVIFEAELDPPGGELGAKFAGLFSDPLGVKLNNDLRRAKQLIELGDIVVSDDSARQGPNPARPVGQGQPA